MSLGLSSSGTTSNPTTILLGDRRISSWLGALVALEIGGSTFIKSLLDPEKERDDDDSLTGVTVKRQQDAGSDAEVKSTRDTCH